MWDKSFGIAWHIGITWAAGIEWRRSATDIGCATGARLAADRANGTGVCR